MTLADVDFIFRGVAVGELLVLLLAFAREIRRAPAIGYGVTLIVSVIAYLLASSPRLWEEMALFQFPVLILAAGTMPNFWMFSRAWYDDEFRPNWRVYALAGGVVGMTFLHVFVFAAMGGAWSEWSFWICQGSAYIYAADALWRVWSRRADDLVEARRRARPTFVASVAIYAFGATTAEMLYGWAPGVQPWVVLDMAGIATLVLFLSCMLLRIGEPGTFPRQESVAEAPPRLNPDFEKLAKRLDQLMTKERIYRDNGLVIAALAHKMDIQEYRLRRLINQHLGYRNFNAYLNAYRIEEAKRALADPSQRRVPILTVALDAGFSSLGPFNRAFKDACGTTPSEFRRMALSPNSA